MKRLLRLIRRLLGWDKDIVYWKRGGEYVEVERKRE
jgi:hypothetical protein